MAQAMTAVYDTRGAAEAARDGLLALGIDPADVSLQTSGKSERIAKSGSGARGFWQNLFELFIPEHEHPTYLEHLRRGGFMIAAHVPDGRERDAEKVLERGQPADVTGKGTPAGAGSSGTRVRTYPSRQHEKP